MVRLPSLRPRSKRGRWQTGQSIVILAIGFIALLGFVGIVTDVSLLFVRYSSLSRAVDAAAVAAAGQMRRVADDPIAGIDGEAASVAQLGLAARQYIEVYGLDPSNVLVETCRVQRYRDSNGVPMDDHGNQLFLSDGSVNPAADAVAVDRYQRLCTNDEEKLVRVTAQIDAPTTFLYLLGYRTVTLTVEAISQTAVLDVALIFDVSENMLAETQYSDWQAAGYGWRYLPPSMYQIRAQGVGIYNNSSVVTTDPTRAVTTIGSASTYPNCWNWATIVGMSQNQVLAGFDVRNPRDRNDAITDPSDPNYYNLFHCDSTLFDYESTVSNRNPNPTLTDPYTGANYNYPSPYRWLTASAAADGATNEPVRSACRVRIWPETFYSRFSVLNSWLVDEYIQNDASDPAPFATEAAMRAYFRTGTTAATTASLFMGFVPSFNYYGCCNDPNADWDFSDLVCQPFGDARDAAQGFLERLDFLRGDRIAYITYDRHAMVIDPDGIGDQIPMMESQNNITDGTGSIIRYGAEEVLNQIIGVRTESTFYHDTNSDGQWDCIVAGGADASTGNAECLSNLDDIQSEVLYNIANHPVKGACPLDPVEMDAQFNGPHGSMRWDAANGRFVLRSANYNIADAPLDDITTDLSLSGTMPSWYTSLTYPSPPTRDYTYEYRASCAGGNIGGALGTASNMLYLNGRREGAVWLMVLLSSGASGASDAMGRLTYTNNAGVQVTSGTPVIGLSPAPFHVGGYHTADVYDPITSTTGATVTAQVYEPIAGDYGSYGLCPYGLIDGTHNQPGELLKDRYPPFCSDIYPQTRTFCQSPSIADPPNSVALDNAQNPYCEAFYDTDDYARDWADYIGVSNLNTGTGAAARSGAQLLPTIFTIGFGLTYDAQTNAQGEITGYACATGDYNCQRGLSGDLHNLTNQLRISDYLGEELLRYIADVGDNLRVDSDYWQYFMQNRVANGINHSDLHPDYGPRGACEVPVSELPGGVQIQDYSPLPPRTSCGNYFVAVTASDLNLVFNEIASRMFTRLSQ